MGTDGPHEFSIQKHAFTSREIPHDQIPPELLRYGAVRLLPATNGAD